MSKTVSSRRVAIVISDSVPNIRIVRQVLEEADFVVHDVQRGREGLSAAATLKPDLIVMEADLPDMQPWWFLQSLREWSNIPVLVMAPTDEAESMVALLKAEADDVVVKPFHWDVFLARCLTIMRRALIKENGEAVITVDPIKMDLLTHTVTVGGEIVQFTPKQYELLKFFMQAPNRIHAIKDIMKAVWGPAHVDDIQYLRVYIGEVRKRLETVRGASDVIVSKAGFGYMLDPTKYNSAKISARAEEQRAAASV